ncbi:hypothetical protein [Nonomuraea dietziae]|uniref:hypothetical protein n=1 Tax=Nonomuraea dietziae TaxID=65515 RepID=UPI0033E649DB
MTRWLTRDDLTTRSATGLLNLTGGLPLRPELTAEALRQAGVGEGDRVVVALAEPVGGLWASAAASVAEAAASVGPRGRMRLHHALQEMGATTLVATPTGAMDFLARLHLEFLLDPLDLGLRHIVLTGEIASRRTLGHLASEFEARVSEVYSSPFSGGALAWRPAESEPLTPLAEGVLGLASIGKDTMIDEGRGELVIPYGDAVLRTGQVTVEGRLAHTVGEHVLVRGVWLSLPRMEKALSKIDGVSGWELAISRQGTLDAAALTVTFARQSLVKNPMWRSRIQQALAALTPISIAVEISPDAAESATPCVVTDHRGHHLGRDRALV